MNADNNTSSLKYASYTIDNITATKANSLLDISSNCIVKLYKVIDSKEQLVSDTYNTQIEYRNDTNSDISIIIDIDNNFTWRNTDEGHYFWDNIEKEYDLFLHNNNCITKNPYLNYKTIQNETKHKNNSPPF